MSNNKQQIRKLSSKTKQTSRSSLSQLLSILLVFLTGCFFSSTILLYTYPLQHYSYDVATSTSANSIVEDEQDGGRPVTSHIGTTSSNKSFSQTHSQAHEPQIISPPSSSVIHAKRILVALASFDFSQFPLLEEVLDAYQDLCFAGASKVDVYIYTTVPYTVALIDLLNTRFSCHGLQIFIVVKSPSVRLNLVDFHRTLFYEKIDDYDLFIYSEDDILVKPTTVATYLQETAKVEKLVSKSPAEDYNIGIVRYEYNYPPDVIINDKTRHATESVTRVYWEHLWKPLIPKSLHSPQEILNSADEKVIKEHFVTMENAHQGMFLATAKLLKAWKDRPNCQFDVIRQRPGLKKRPSQPAEGTQRVWMSSNMLHGKRHCNVKQLIPIRNFGQVTVWHLPNKNYRRVGKKGRIGGDGSNIENEFGTGKEKFMGPDPSLPTAMQYHLEMRKNYGYPGEDSSSPYSGIMMINEVDGSKRVRGYQNYPAMLEERMKAYEDYVTRGGKLADSDYDNWKWTVDRI